jgi:hypothetical protein
MHPIVYNSLEEYDLRQSTQATERSQHAVPHIIILILKHKNIIHVKICSGYKNFDV